jgi:ArsR family transcriptional regulator, arsenate/arsenite/antimonite-responsive transcriptional repressor
MKADLKTVESTYKALADATRLRILTLLVDGEVCVCDIHDSLRLPQPTVSRHLAYLRRTGLVEARRQATWMHYRLADVAPVIKSIVQQAAHAMSHVSASGQDRRRFEKGCGRMLAVVNAPHAPCCGGGEHEHPVRPS